MHLSSALRTGGLAFLPYEEVRKTSSFGATSPRGVVMVEAVIMRIVEMEKTGINAVSTPLLRAVTTGPGLDVKSLLTHFETNCPETSFLNV